TGVPEFKVDYQIIRTRENKFRTRGSISQNFESLHLPVDVRLRAEGGDVNDTLLVDGKGTNFDIESNGLPLEVIVDPDNKLLRSSDDLKVNIAARKGIELYRDGQYSEAQQQLQEALKLDRSNSWVYYHLGLIFLEQQNYQQALDNFQAALDGNLKPGWIEVWSHIKRGNAYDARGDRNRATFEYRRAMRTGIDYDNAQAEAKKYLATPYDSNQG
ncbi:MAG: tetratricopeptide repeat protein, partial [Pyrinomonadaceae bacterium]